MAIPIRCFLALLIGALTCRAVSQTNVGWPTYGGDPGGQRYSSATEINRSNVNTLRVAWIYHTHALDRYRPGARSAAFETTPVLFRNSLYLTTPFDAVIALDAATGQEHWIYDPKLAKQSEGGLITSRGVAMWDGSGSGPCSTRAFVGTLDARLIAIDAVDGKACNDFGIGGVVSLTEGVAHQEGHGYGVTSAPTVVGDVVVVGSSIADNQYVDAEMGVVRGFSARSGRLLWTWDPIPWAMTQKLRTGGANAWSTISSDADLGLIYVPTGSASPDYYGGMRPGDNRDADSVVALDAKTGQKRWAFQVVHHNVWDYDVASEPLLFTWRGTTPAIAVNTKMGQVFVLDRRTGAPLFPVEERMVPQSDVPGEQTSATQPFSSLPRLGPMTMQDGPAGWQRDAKNTHSCDEQLQALRYEGMYTPPSLKGSVEFPGALGGVNWGGAAFDQVSGIMYANNNRYAYAVWLAPPAPIWKLPWVIIAILLGAGCLKTRSWRPGWGFLLAALLIGVMAMERVLLFKLIWPEIFLKASVQAPFGDDHSPNKGAPYALHRKPIRDVDGHPCTKTPWGALTAMNLNTGKKLWETSEGTIVDGVDTGSIGLSGPIVTAGGLVFTAATKQPLLRAFDSATGIELWQGKLPVPAQATPMTYEVGNRQFIVISAGGHGSFGTEQGDSVIAFSLP